MRPDPLSSLSWEWSNYTYANDNPIGFIDPDGRSSERTCSRGYSSLDIDVNSKVFQINRDGDPGVYMHINGGRVLVGYMDPNETYKIGSSYRPYSKKDYYDIHPIVYVWGMKTDNPDHRDPNPDQNNLEAAKKEALGSAITTVLLCEFSEILAADAETAATANAIRASEEAERFAMMSREKLLSDYVNRYSKIIDNFFKGKGLKGLTREMLLAYKELVVRDMASSLKKINDVTKTIQPERINQVIVALREFFKF
jgi:hypothetical protein